MTLLSILYRPQPVIIGAKNPKTGLIASAVDNFKETLIRPWTAQTSRGITVDCTISEEHLTQVEPTENPIEGGAVATDHVTIKPKQLTIDGVITDAPLGFYYVGAIQNVVRTVASVFGKQARSIEAYDDLVRLQESRQPFTVVTGLKRYENMILKELSVPRTTQTGRAIHFRATMQEIIIVKSQTVVGTDSLAPSIRDAAAPTKDYGQRLSDPIPLTGAADQNASQRVGSFASGYVGPNFPFQTGL